RDKYRTEAPCGGNTIILIRAPAIIILIVRSTYERTRAHLLRKRHRSRAAAGSRLHHNWLWQSGARACAEPARQRGARDRGTAAERRLVETSGRGRPRGSRRR